jgi:catechol 2,3-dioxygenase-like lactoylglutathione lyase family enzyme
VISFGGKMMAQNAAQTSSDDVQFTGAFSSFSVDDIGRARSFYAEVLGLDARDRSEGLELHLPGGHRVFIYQKADHEAANFTVLNLMVDDIAKAVEKLSARGISFESYGGEIETDDQGIMWGPRQGRGPNLAWFRDPAGNFVSVVENQ